MFQVLSIQIVQATVIILLAFILGRLTVKACSLIEKKQWLPATLMIPLSGFLKWTIWISGILFILEVFGLPIKSLWAGILSVMLLVAVAFVASWSVLSNILSAVLLLTFSRARIGDIVELRDTKQDEMGIRGRIIDINLFFVTLQELNIDEGISRDAAITQVPCHLFFYRVTRCWRGQQTQPLMHAFTEEHGNKDVDRG